MYDTREAVVRAIEADDPERPACYLMVGGMLVGWHTPQTGAADVLVFQEHFSGERLVGWQERLVCDYPGSLILGHRSANSLRATWAVPLLRPLTRKEIAALRERFGCV